MTEERSDGAEAGRHPVNHKPHKVGIQYLLAELNYLLKA